jgi:hypothetical protein
MVVANILDAMDVGLLNVGAPSGTQMAGRFRVAAGSSVP